MWTFDVLLLLPGLGSVVADDTVAVFKSVPDLDTVGAMIVSVIGGAAPTASEGLVHVTVPAANPQVQPVPVALTKLEPAGSTSVTVTENAVSGP
jgi:hypothetical protein